MISLKDFKVGQKAYRVRFFVYISRKGEIQEVYFHVVGRKYVKISSSPYSPDSIASLYSFEVNEPEADGANCLVQHEDYGTHDLLFCSLKDYEDWRELQDLRKWFYEAAHNARKLSLDQLRQVKGIIEPF